MAKVNFNKQAILKAWQFGYILDYYNLIAKAKKARLNEIEQFRLLFLAKFVPQN